MNKFKRRLVFLLCMIGVTVFLVLIIKYQIPDQKTQGVTRLDQLVKNSSEIHRIWFEGENSKEWGRFKKKCTEKWGIPDDYDESLVRCNPILINCLNDFGGFQDINFSDRDIEFVSNYTGGKAGAGVVGYLFKISDKLTRESLEFVLKDNCHENYLEQRIYAYGEINKNTSDDYLFDTFNQNIYFDRHLVTVREFNEYKVFKKQKPIELNGAINLFTAVYDISFDEMKDYCTFRGKKMMEAQVFDAASFIPIEENEKGVKVVKRAPMYWSKSKKEKIKSCDEAYTLECLDEKKFRINSTEPTWAGLYDAQGGYLEAFNNPIDPRKNLKMSSFYFKRDSKWNSLGLRSFWKGNGSDLTQFETQEFELDPNINQLKVGFRCMRLVD